MKRFRPASGVTLIEMSLAVAIFSVVAVGFAMVVKVLSTTAIKSELSARSTLTAQQVFVLLESDLYSSNEVTVASSTFVQFICDSSRAPGYNPTALTANLIQYQVDPDVDGDINQIEEVADQWKTGSNLVDDDDDNDGQVDMVVRYFLVGTELYRDMVVNGMPYSSRDSESEASPWGNNRRRIATNVRAFSLVYHGSKENDLGTKIDLGHDGAASTADTGEGDGLIDQLEMDAVLPAAGGGGNNNGRLDLATEKVFITSIGVHLEIDSNGDGTPEYTMDTEIYPPLLPLKPFQRG